MPVESDYSAHFAHWQTDMYVTPAMLPDECQLSLSTVALPTTTVRLTLTRHQLRRLYNKIGTCLEQMDAKAIERAKEVPA